MAVFAFLVWVFALVWLGYKAATYALPCGLGLLAARVAFETGAGWVAAFALMQMMTQTPVPMLKCDIRGSWRCWRSRRGN
jgi:hypothetical protein